MQLLQVRTSPVTAASTTSGVSPGEGSTRVSEQCIARGVLQPDALLGGVTREWSGRLVLVKEVPLFDAKGVRLGLHAGETGTDEVCTTTWHIGIAHGCMTTISLMTCIQRLVISHAVSSQAPWLDLVRHARCEPAACSTACIVDHRIYIHLVQSVTSALCALVTLSVQEIFAVKAQIIMSRPSHRDCVFR